MGFDTASLKRSEHYQTLSKYVERRRAVTFMRRVDFDAPDKEKIARWAEEKGVAGALPLDVKRQLWGWDEAEENQAVGLWSPGKMKVNIISPAGVASLPNPLWKAAHAPGSIRDRAAPSRGAGNLPCCAVGLSWGLSHQLPRGRMAEDWRSRRRAERIAQANKTPASGESPEIPGAF